MTPERQFAESVKYTARPLVIILINDQFVIMKAYGTRREPICTIPPAELARWATDDFSRQRSWPEEGMKSKAPLVSLDIDFDL